MRYADDTVIHRINYLLSSMLGDFDLPIGTTAHFQQSYFGDKNVSDFDRLDGIVIED